MAKLKSVERKIANVEGFKVTIRDVSGRDVRSDKAGLPAFPYQNAAKKDFTVAQWRQQRFKKVYPGYEVTVSLADGTQAHGSTKLETVRNSHEINRPRRETPRQDPVTTWKRAFRAAAKADKYAMIRDHLERLGLDYDDPGPEAMVETTILMFEWHDGDILDMQTYDPLDSTEESYVYTFHLEGGSYEGYARVIIDNEHKPDVVDLADMFDGFNLFFGPGYSGVVGFNEFWISRPDWRSLTDKERQNLKGIVLDDLYFDYTKEDIEVQFDDIDDNDESFLFVRIVELDQENDTGDEA